MAELNIYAPIVNDDEKAFLQYIGSDGVSFPGVMDFIKGIPADDNEINIHLHCPGGEVREGWAIVDSLRATGKRISAVIEGECASMASVVLLAASERKGAQHATLLIHDPFIPGYCLPDMTADDLAKYKDELSKERERILDFYVERTGTDRDTLDAQMKAGTEMDMERARELGFIQEIMPPLSARKNHYTKSIKDMEKKSLFKKITDAIALALGVDQPILNYELKTADGGSITIDKPDGEDPAVGDSASPDGEHLMPDGRTIVIADGKITEIREPNDDPDNDPDEEKEALKARVAELEKQLADSKAEAQSEVTDLHKEIDSLKAKAKTTEEMEILNLVTIAGGKDWLIRAKSNYKPNDRDVKRGTTATADPIQEKLKAAKERNGLKD